LVDQLRDRSVGRSGAGLGIEWNVSLIVGVTKDLQRVQAGKVIGPVAQRVGGKGGGRRIWPRPGKRCGWLDAALDGLTRWWRASGMTQVKIPRRTMHFIKHKDIASS